MMIKGTKCPDIARCCDRGMVFAFCALAFCLPISIALTDSFAGLAIFLYFVKRIHRLAGAWPAPILKGLAPAKSVLNGPIAVLAAVTFISALHSQFVGLSLFAFVGKFLKVIFLYFSFIEVFTSKKRIVIFVSVFLGSAFLISLDGIIQHFCGLDLLAGHRLPPDGRVSSSMKMANSFGVYLIAVLGLATPLVFAGDAKRKSSLLRLGLAVLLAMLMFCLTWTFSRASWVGFMAAMVFMMFFGWRKIFVSALLLAVFLVFSLPLLKTMRDVSLFKDNPAATVDLRQPLIKIVDGVLSEGGSGRIHFWQTAVFLIEKHPVLGSGLNTYTRMLRKFSLPYWYAHNSYLQIAAETGWTGLACFLWMLFVFMRNGIGAINRGHDPWLNAVLMGGMTGAFAFLANSFFENSLFEVQLVVLFWLIVALTAAVMNLNHKIVNL
ncbi:MAG: O-antigen ligase family protein [Candidatus Omnitrophica bacterium]|nr:O-antigen ligase family protein [Candidatus Omnitrophota bacterium]